MLDTCRLCGQLIKMQVIVSTLLFCAGHMASCVGSLQLLICSCLSRHLESNPCGGTPGLTCSGDCPLLVQIDGQTKVCHLQHPFAGEQQVLWLDVPARWSRKGD